MSDSFLVHQPSPRSLVPVDEFAGSAAVQPHSAPEFDGEHLSFQGIVDAIFRWRLLFISIALTTVLLATAWASFQTPLYRATATLQLNPAPTPVVQTDARALQDQAQPDEDFLALQLGLIDSRDLAQRVARVLNLGANETFFGKAPAPGDAREAAVRRLMGGFSASGTASARIMQISFVHPNPALAAKITNAFADQAIEANFERGLNATARSREFLQRRLDATRQNLEKSERALIEYARRAKIINVVSNDSPSSGDAAGGTLLASNLVSLNQQLADAQNARIVAQQKFAQAAAAGKAARASDATAQVLQQQRAALQSDYDQKLQTFKPDYPDMQALQARIAALDAQIQASGAQASSAVTDSLRADMVAAQNRERALQGRISQLEGQFLNLNDRGVQYTILKRSVDADRSMYNALLEQLGVENSSATRTSSIAVVDTATVPGAPFSPNIPRTLVLALLIGLALGTAAAVAADRLYDTINTPEDMRSVGLAVLGVVPPAESKELFESLIADPQTPIAEAFHSVRASLQFATSEGTPKSILFTSGRAAEGKTSTVIAIAADFLSLGKRVVVIDADLRKPSFAGDSPGLSGVLAKMSTLQASLLSSDNPNLSLLPAGRVPPNPTALLTGNGLADLVRSLELRFDIVLIDAPPVLGFADAPLLAAVAKATVIVVAARSTPRSGARDAIARLKAAGGTVVGGILNKFDRKAAGLAYSTSNYTYYNYQYGAGKRRTRSLIAAKTNINTEAAE